MTLEIRAYPFVPVKVVRDVVVTVVAELTVVPGDGVITRMIFLITG